ncbi:MAG: GNAT family N-acetyltransferase [Clostridia bacterium]
MENISIRKIRVSDSEQLINLMNEVAGETDFLTFTKGAIKTTVEQQNAYIQKVVESMNSIIFVAEYNSFLVGMLDFSAPPNERTRHCGEFGMLVRKEYWGKGIGKSLVRELIEWAKQTNIIAKINLKVREDNIRAIKLYENFGFKVEGLVTKAFKVNGKFYSTRLMGQELS